MDVPYNDTAQVEDQQENQRVEVNSSKLPQPEISIIVDGNRIFKPGMKSVFIEDDSKVSINSGLSVTTAGDTDLRGYCSCNSVTVCTCNTVCTCEGVCTCESVCSCVGHCSCNQVCTCDNHCSCNQVCTCDSQCTCQSVGGGGCACAPVH